MERILVILVTIVGLVYCFRSYPYGASAALLSLAMSVPVLYYIRTYSEDKETLTTIFLLALLVRLSLGLVIDIFGLQNVFGPDAFVYDSIAVSRIDQWNANGELNFFVENASFAWGMLYIVAGLIFGIWSQHACSSNILLRDRCDDRSRCVFLRSEYL